MRIKDDNAVIEELEDKVKQLEARSRHLDNELKLLKQEYDAVSEWNFELVSYVEERVKQREAESELYRKKLDQNNLELNIMLDSCPAMIFFKDVELRYVRVNSEFSNKLGFPISRIIGKRYDELFDDVNSWYRKSEDKILITGESADIVSGPVKTAGGELELLVKKVPHKDIDGNVVGIIGFAIDVSELKRAEKEKSSLENELLRAKKLEALGEMASCVAHDLNQLLTGIVSYPDLMASKLPKDMGVDKYLKAIKQSGLRAAAITRDLLTLGRKRQHRERVNLKDVVDNYISSVEFGLLQTRFPGINLKTDIEESCMDILGSPVHLSQMLMNLISNAFEAVADRDGLEGVGEVLLSTELLFDEDSINRFELESYIVLKLEDNGKGIDLPSDEINKIFDPFYSSKKLGKSGSGLGMTVVKQVVDEHDGFIFVSSRRNCGTTFDIYFPSAVRSKENTGPTPGRVLLIDLISHTGLGESKFVEEGFHVIKTVSSGEALVRLEGYSFKMVFILIADNPECSNIAELVTLIENAGTTRTVIAGNQKCRTLVSELRRDYKHIEFMEVSGEAARSGDFSVSNLFRDKILL